jgi:hypothetical protein
MSLRLGPLENLPYVPGGPCIRACACDDGSQTSCLTLRFLTNALEQPCLRIAGHVQAVKESYAEALSQAPRERSPSSPFTSDEHECGTLKFWPPRRLTRTVEARAASQQRLDSLSPPSPWRHEPLRTEDARARSTPRWWQWRQQWRRRRAQECWHQCAPTIILPVNLPTARPTHYGCQCQRHQPQLGHVGVASINGFFFFFEILKSHDLGQKAVSSRIPTKS